MLVQHVRKFRESKQLVSVACSIMIQGYDYYFYNIVQLNSGFLSRSPGHTTRLDEFA